jgi:hypothetical protein
MGLDRYVPNRGGLKALLRSQGVRAMLHGRAERVAEAARARGQRMESPDRDVLLPIRVESSIGAVRARATVIADHPGALNAEAKHRILGGAIDAAG